ncbi:MAG: gliding motility lipoprotein GldH [Chitinophagaceae bacterium]
MKLSSFLPYRSIQVISLAMLGLLLFSCTQVDLYEKTTAVPGHAWQSSFKPSFEFDLTDSSKVYEVFLVLRHNEKYHFNNIYVNLYIQGPGQDTAMKIQRELPLAANDKWLGDGMDDIYEHRMTIGLLGESRAIRPGRYRLQVEQIMRENPLQNVLDVGLRVEKK